MTDKLAIKSLFQTLKMLFSHFEKLKLTPVLITFVNMPNL